jgi:hypothetical protein
VFIGFKDYYPNILNLREDDIGTELRLKYYAMEISKMADKRCAIIMDESKIQNLKEFNNILPSDDFGASYHRGTDTYFANLEDTQVVMYIVQGVNSDWWFLYEFLFYKTTDNVELETKLNEIIENLKAIYLIPVVILGDMAGRIT